jgi:hypothetical protein
MIRISRIRTRKILDQPITTHPHWLVVLLVALALVLPGSRAFAAPLSIDPIEPQAGSWRTWLVSSGSQLRRARPAGYRC